ncbi:hypothetical protein V6N11_058016 [Hibiscus sabdariffa]|uniref:DUF659 domain-containing protein n=1 Tax=Hibiscus sabdariffa TaxID=183260 RepID=A0ABR1ZXD8_9ROSI
MLKGVNQAPKDYKPSSFDRARTTLVDECQRELEKELTLVKEKTGANIAEFLLESIEEVGSSNVLQVITDNAANCKSVGKEIEKANAIFKSQYDLELLKVAKTRFASHYLLLKRLSRCREALETTTVLRCWREWVNSGDECTKALVFIHSNIRLLSRFTTSYKEGPCKKWDIDPESTYFDDSTVRLEDLR